MKIAIIGVGAIGGYMAVKLALAGEDITLIARGANLQALRTRGLRLIYADGTEEHVAHVKATDGCAAAGPQDLVIIAVKAHQLEAVTEDIAALLGPETMVLPMQNGIPYWYFHGYKGPLAGTRVKSVDPNGIIYDRIPCERVIGCVVYLAGAAVAPGVIKHVEGHSCPIGEPDGSNSARVAEVSQCFDKCGLQAPVLGDIRAEIWFKLWGNLTFNPISALTRATLVAMCQYPLTRAIAAAMMVEAQAVAGKLGVTFRVPLEERIMVAERVGHHKTSMLQDLEAGRVMEIEALIGSVVELARLTETPTPHIDTVYALSKLLGETVARA